MTGCAPFSRVSPPLPSRATRQVSPTTSCGGICSAFSAPASSVSSIIEHSPIRATRPRSKCASRSMCSNRSCVLPLHTPSPLGNSPGLSRPAMNSPLSIAGSGESSSCISSPPRYCPCITRPRNPRPSRHSQRVKRLLQALGPDHLLLRFRTYREYPTEEQARWRIIELLEVGFRPRRVAKLLAIQVAVVYQWQRRFHALGLVGLTTQPRTDTPITMRVSVQAIKFIPIKLSVATGLGAPES